MRRRPLREEREGRCASARFEAPPEEVARQLLHAAEAWLGGEVEAWQLHAAGLGPNVARRRYTARSF
jgi:hypothetical protein